MDNYQELHLQINNLISSLENKTYDDFKTALNTKIKKINIKDNDDSNLVIISNNYTKKINTLSELEKECRSLIIDKTTLKIICYTYDDIYYNQDAKNYFLKNNIKEYDIQECFEGTLLSIFYYNDKRFMSTRQCLDAKESLWSSNKSYYDLFLECINLSFEDFTNHLKPEYNYFFVLLHHENKNIVDYSDYFKNANYKEIVHILTRNQNTLSEIDLRDNSQWNINPNIKTPIRFNSNKDSESIETESLTNFINNNDSLTINTPEKYINFDILDDINKQLNLTLPVQCEGLVVRVKDQKTGKLVIMKFQTNSYQFMSIIRPNNNNIYSSFIELYQQDLLNKHLEYFPGNSELQLEECNEKYDTIGVIDAVFKVLTSELLEIFKSMYNLKDGTHKPKSYYNILPKEYTVVLYKIRGIFFRKKDRNVKKYDDNDESFYSNGLKIFDIYNLLKKKYESKDLFKLLKARKNMMFKYQNDNSDEAEFFNNASHRCDKVSIKMMSFILNEMFSDGNNLNVYKKYNVKKTMKDAEYIHSI